MTKKICGIAIFQTFTQGKQIIDLINRVAQQIRLLNNEGNDFWFEEFKSFEKSIIRKIGISLISYKLVLIFSRRVSTFSH